MRILVRVYKLGNRNVLISGIIMNHQQSQIVLIIWKHNLWLVLTSVCCDLKSLISMASKIKAFLAACKMVEMCIGHKFVKQNEV